MLHGSIRARAREGVKFYFERGSTRDDDANFQQSTHQDAARVRVLPLAGPGTGRHGSRPLRENVGITSRFIAASPRSPESRQTSGLLASGHPNGEGKCNEGFESVVEMARAVEALRARRAARVAMEDVVRIGPRLAGRPATSRAVRGPPNEDFGSPPERGSPGTPGTARRVR